MPVFHITPKTPSYPTHYPYDYPYDLGGIPSCRARTLSKKILSGSRAISWPVYPLHT
eukprot:gene9786-18767_t